MLRRISITGPECTGKSWLAKKLSTHYNTSWVPEYAVEYLRKRGPEYSLQDVLNIAKGQLYLENKIAETANMILFADTDVLVSKIWCLEVFGEVPDWIENQLTNHQYDLYLLCAPDIDWQPGPFRENPEDRDRLFNLYEAQLMNYNMPYAVIRGEGNERFKNALNFVKERVNPNLDHL